MGFDIKLTHRALSEHVFVKRHRFERDIAVLFMVNMSGSTKGWINDAERESLVLLCETLEILGGRYAIYGFSGMTRKRCELYRIKRFDEPYRNEVKRAGIHPFCITTDETAHRLSTAHVRRGELGAGGQRAQTAAQGFGHLPTPNTLRMPTHVVAH